MVRPSLFFFSTGMALNVLCFDRVRERLTPHLMQQAHSPLHNERDYDRLCSQEVGADTEICIMGETGPGQARPLDNEAVTHLYLENR